MKLVNSDLLILIPILNTLGIFLKKSKIDNDRIPLILAILSITLCSLHSYSIKKPESWVLFIYENIHQGLLIAAASVFNHQVYKRNKKQAA